ncbi:MAG: hypothetical protein E6G58_08430 [Actinobacteria bacterium]|nr:MAG: hypothetical protein E6G58_08430 [Actinomycetota bacterium]
MSPRRRAAAVGAALCLAYLAGALVSGSLGPTWRRPILDGLVPPPMYRWVAPPPALASTNQHPSTGRSTIQLDPAKGSAATVFSTRDFQASLALGQGAIAPHGQDTKVQLTMTPLAPKADAIVPAGIQIAGNVVEVTATYEPSGASVVDLRTRGELGLVYPLLFQGVGFEDTMLRSTDERSWAAIPSDDAIAQQSVHAAVGRLSLFAVGQSPVGPTAPPSPSATRSGSIVVAVLAAIALLGAVWFLRRRSPPPPPRSPRRTVDPWED